MKTPGVAGGKYGLGLAWRDTSCGVRVYGNDGDALAYQSWSFSTRGHAPQVTVALTPDFSGDPDDLDAPSTRSWTRRSAADPRGTRRSSPYWVTSAAGRWRTLRGDGKIRASSLSRRDASVMANRSGARPRPR